MDVGRDVHAGGAMSERTRTLTLSAERLRWYSRRGNFHADPDAARDLGLPDLVAQGMQVAGPAYGLLLDEWGEEWLTRGMIELTFVGMVTADETVEARVDVDSDHASGDRHRCRRRRGAGGRSRRASRCVGELLT